MTLVEMDEISFKDIDSCQDLDEIKDLIDDFSNRGLSKIDRGEEFRDNLWESIQAYIEKEKKDEISLEEKERAFYYISLYRKVRNKETNAHSDDGNKFLDFLAEGLYDDPSHFLMELIQNADDAVLRSKEANSDFKSGDLEFIVEDNSLILEYRENGFNLNDLSKIVSIGDSSKLNIEEMKKERTQIGEKGIGFKSVFYMAKSVNIKSSNYNFLISHGDYVSPKSKTEEEIANEKRYANSAFYRCLNFYDQAYRNADGEAVTRLEISFKESDKNKEVLAGIKANLDRYFENPGEIFLFLQAIDRIKYDGEIIELVREEIELDDPDARASFLWIADEKFIRYEELLSFSKKAAIDRWKSLKDGIDSLEDDFKFRKEISICFPFEPYNLVDGEILVKDGRVFSFLPTNLSLRKLPIYLNIDANLKGSRGDIKAESFKSGDSWNRELLDQMDGFLIRSYNKLVDILETFQDEDIERFKENMVFFLPRREILDRQQALGDIDFKDFSLREPFENFSRALLETGGVYPNRIIYSFRSTWLTIDESLAFVEANLSRSDFPWNLLDLELSYLENLEQALDAKTLIHPSWNAYIWETIFGIAPDIARIKPLDIIYYSNGILESIYDRGDIIEDIYSFIKDELIRPGSFSKEKNNINLFPVNIDGEIVYKSRWNNFNDEGHELELFSLGNLELPDLNGQNKIFYIVEDGYLTDLSHPVDSKILDEVFRIYQIENYDIPEYCKQKLIMNIKPKKDEDSLFEKLIGTIIEILPYYRENMDLIDQVFINLGNKKLSISNGQTLLKDLLKLRYIESKYLLKIGEDSASYIAYLEKYIDHINIKGLDQDDILEGLDKEDLSLVLRALKLMGIYSYPRLENLELDQISLKLLEISFKYSKDDNIAISEIILEFIDDKKPSNKDEFIEHLQIENAYGRYAACKKTYLLTHKDLFGSYNNNFDRHLDFIEDSLDWYESLVENKLKKGELEQDYESFILARDSFKYSYLLKDIREDDKINLLFKIMEYRNLESFYNFLLDSSWHYTTEITISELEFFKLFNHPEFRKDMGAGKLKAGIRVESKEARREIDSRYEEILLRTKKSLQSLAVEEKFDNYQAIENLYLENQASVYLVNSPDIGNMTYKIAYNEIKSQEGGYEWFIYEELLEGISTYEGELAFAEEILRTLNIRGEAARRFKEKMGVSEPLRYFVEEPIASYKYRDLYLEEHKENLKNFEAIWSKSKKLKLKMARPYKGLAGYAYVCPICNSDLSHIELNGFTITSLVSDSGLGPEIYSFYSCLNCAEFIKFSKVNIRNLADLLLEFEDYYESDDDPFSYHKMKTVDLDIVFNGKKRMTRKIKISYYHMLMLYHDNKRIIAKK